MRAWWSRLTRRWQEVGLRGRITVAVLCLGVLPALVLGYFVERQYSRLLREQAVQLTVASLQQAQQLVALYLSEIQNIGLFVMSNTTIEGALESPLPSVYQQVLEAQTLQQLLASYPTAGASVQRIIIAGGNGFSYDNGFYAGDLYRALGQDPATAPLLRALAASPGRPLWSFDASTQELVMAQEIDYANLNHPVGILLVHLSGTDLAGALQPFGSGRSRLLLADAHGHVVLQPIGAAGPGVGRWLSTLGPASAAVLGNTVVARQPLRGTPWTLWRIAPLRAVPLGARGLRIDVAAIVAAAVLLTAGLSVWLARRLTQPVEELVALMAAFEQDAWPPHPSGRPMVGELGRLQRSFLSMAQRIHTLIDQVYREQLQRREAEWQALQAQIRPHFLANTLDSIGWLARQHGVPQIRDMTLALSRLLRLSLRRGPDLVPLREELAYAQAYLRIQEIRYEGRIRTELDVPAALAEAPVPRLILQPLVENACVHGLEPRGRGRITIRARQEGSALVLEVADDGVGMAPGQMARLGTDQGAGSGHVGLANTRQRLQTLFGDLGRCTIASAPGQGTRVELRMPAPSAA